MIPPRPNARKRGFLANPPVAPADPSARVPYRNRPTVGFWPMPADAADRLRFVQSALEALRGQAVCVVYMACFGSGGGPAHQAAARESGLAQYRASLAKVQLACAWLLDGLDDTAALEWLGANGHADDFLRAQGVDPDAHFGRTKVGAA